VAFTVISAYSVAIKATLTVNSTKRFVAFQRRRTAALGDMRMCGR
jgi:hypothetical protein